MLLLYGSTLWLLSAMRQKVHFFNLSMGGVGSSAEESAGISKAELAKPHNVVKDIRSA